MPQVTTITIRQAAFIIQAAESDLKRPLSEGERRDLLKDNTNWSSRTVERLVKTLREESK